MQRSKWLATMTFIGLLVAACLAPTAATPAGSPANALPATDPPLRSSAPLTAPAADDCYSVQGTYEQPPLTVALLARTSKLAVVGSVKGLGTGKFNTNDGGPPADPRVRPGNHPLVFTPVTIDVAEPIVGDPGTGSLQAAVEGGTFNNCVVYRVAQAPALVAGQKYVLFMNDGRDVDDSPRPDRPTIFAAWAVADDGTVQTPEDGVMPLAELTSRLGGG